MYVLNVFSSAVALTDEALRVIEVAKRNKQQKYLFCLHNGKPLCDVAMSKFMKDRGFEARPHGFRAWIEETTYTEYKVKEIALAHVVDSETVRVYQRSDRLRKQRTLMENWSNYLGG